MTVGVFHELRSGGSEMSGVRPRFTLALLAVLVSGSMMLDFPFAAGSSRASAGEYDRPTKNPHQSRSATVASHGIVATSQPLAAQVGLDILKAGGNAADAAIATDAMMGLVEPMSCGIGGDLFCIYWDNKTQKLYGLNASGRSPYALNRAVFKEKGLKEIPGNGILSWSVPGCVDGWDQLGKRFGTMPLSKLIAPAIQYADEGFPVTEIIAGYFKRGELLAHLYPDTGATYYPNGHAPVMGEMFRNPNLATSLRAIAQGGRDAYYRGPIAEQIVSYSQKHGGYFSKRDFEDHTSTWVEPVSTNYRGYDVWELPPNGQGIAVLQILNILEGYDIRSMGRHSPDYLHLFIEAKKLAYADRAKYFADPDFAKLPVQQLISKEYAARQRKRIDPQRAASSVDPGDPLLAKGGDTIYLCVVDKDRNCCSMIQSNFAGFGSRLVPGKVGFVMQNRGSQFSLDPKHLNSLEPHKRPFHTIIPAMVTKDGKPWLTFGVMGGDMQPQGHVQVLLNMIDFGLDVQAAGDAGRVRHDGSQTPTGHAMESGGGEVDVESSIPQATLDELTKRGHRIVHNPDDGFGGYQGIRIDQEHGTLHGGTEPRKDGAAVGY